MFRQNIVSFAGWHEDGEELFDMDLSYPEPTDDDRPCNAMVRASVLKFYGFDLPDDAGYEQGHALLTYRDFAQAFVQQALPELRYKYSLMMQRFVAANISKDEVLSVDIKQWCEMRFERGADPDQAPAAVEKHWAFNDLRQFVRDVIADTREQGATCWGAS